MFRNRASTAPDDDHVPGALNHCDLARKRREAACEYNRATSEIDRQEIGVLLTQLTPVERGLIWSLANWIDTEGVEPDAFDDLAESIASIGEMLDGFTPMQRRLIIDVARVKTANVSSGTLHPGIFPHV